MGFLTLFGKSLSIAGTHNIFFFLPGWQSCRLNFCVGSVGKLHFLQQRNKQLKQIRLQESRLNQSLRHILPKHRVVMKGLFPVFARLNHSLFSSKPPFIRTPHFQNYPEHFHAQGSRQFSFLNVLSMWNQFNQHLKTPNFRFFSNGFQCFPHLSWAFSPGAGVTHLGLAQIAPAAALAGVALAGEVLAGAARDLGGGFGWTKNPRIFMMGVYIFNII